MSAPYPACADRQRLAALYRYEILDTPAERDFDDICTLATTVCETPMATLTFVEQERQWFKSEIGLGVSETPLENSICRHAILEDEILIIPDTLDDDRFRANPFCSGAPGLRFYAGAVIRTPEGHPLGTVCVLDREPRQISTAQIDALRTLARQVMTMLELRRSNRELQKAQGELSTALAAATEANSAKDEFLAKLSHELRTPLTPVVMTAGALLEEPDLSPSVREDVTMILRNVELETRLIDDLLDVTRIAHGKLELSVKECNLHQIVRDALRVCGPALTARAIALEVRLEAPQHSLQGDPTRLQQVFWNLLTNAAKFTPEGGRIACTSRNEVVGEETRWLCELTDNGRGIAPEQIAGLFDAFEQGGRAVTRSYGGLGLGLAICKGVIDLHGGNIAVRSAGVGQGATFSVSLMTASLRNAAEPVPATLPGSARSLAHPLRLLLVEDHAATSAVLTRLLEREGHTVQHASTLAAARRLARAGDFDLVMSDLGLPDGSGLELMAELHREHGWLGIALSGYGMEEDVRRSHEAGFVAHMTKPVDLGQLRRTLEEVTAHLPLGGVALPVLAEA